MDETADRIEEDIGQTRDALKSNLEELETRFKDVTNWRSMVRRHPGAMVLAAAVGGMLVAAMVGRR